MTKAIQICGTGSGVGKSVICAGLCRLFYRDSYTVSPFKAQNMALNSYVTLDGGEIGRAQAEQAYAARISPSVHMNPILIKPNKDTKAQIIVQGKSIGNMSAAEYMKAKKNLLKYVYESYNKLRRRYQLIVIEGAGSPAEINLKQHDFVNMKMAEYADANVILVGDIDKGGVFASIVGTLELLDEHERDRIKGFIINKFRGDKRLLLSGIRFLEKRTGKKVLGVIPYFKDIKISEEDSLSLDNNTIDDTRYTIKKNKINIAVIKLPHISNFTDFDALEREPGVKLRYVKTPQELDGADVIIIPGTKNTISDLAWLKKSGLAQKILNTQYSIPNTCLIGICGGFQMLGKTINDPYSIESSLKKINGLGLFNMATFLSRRKKTYQVTGSDTVWNTDISGYEIHHGQTVFTGPQGPAFIIIKRSNSSIRLEDGCISKNNRAWGTYIHGIFDNKNFRQMFLINAAKVKNCFSADFKFSNFNREEEFDKLADLVKKNIDIGYLYRLLK